MCGDIPRSGDGFVKTLMMTLRPRASSYKTGIITMSLGDASLDEVDTLVRYKLLNETRSWLSNTDVLHRRPMPQSVRGKVPQTGSHSLGAVVVGPQ